MNLRYGRAVIGALNARFHRAIVRQRPDQLPAPRARTHVRTKIETLDFAGSL